MKTKKFIIGMSLLLLSGILSAKTITCPEIASIPGRIDSNSYPFYHDGALWQIVGYDKARWAYPNWSNIYIKVLWTPYSVGSLYVQCETVSGSIDQSVFSEAAPLASACQINGKPIGSGQRFEGRFPVDTVISCK